MKGIFYVYKKEFLSVKRYKNIYRGAVKSRFQEQNHTYRSKMKMEISRGLSGRHALGNFTHMPVRSSGFGTEAG